MEDQIAESATTLSLGIITPSNVEKHFTSDETCLAKHRTLSTYYSVGDVVIQCGGCGEEYIGETGDTLRHRMTLHRQHIRHSNVRKLFVSEHIANYAKRLNIILDYFHFLK